MNLEDSSRTQPISGTFSQKLIGLIFPSLASGVLKIICKSCKQHIRNQTIFDHTVSQYGKVLVAFWHETLALALWHFRNSNYWTLTSLSFDGELAARVVQHFGMNAARGSSSRGGVDAIRQLKEALGSTSAVGLTIDGPKGPRRVAKPGIAILARKTGLPIVPVAFCARPCWRVHSWDRMIIPKPISTIITHYGEPVFPEKNKRIDEFRYEIEKKLNKIQLDIEKDIL